MRDVLDATFPPASVTGTPKHRARELLSQWEPARRGVYCGTVGLASPVAGTELNVAIRTVEFDSAGDAVLGVGGGITADSDPDGRVGGVPAQGGTDHRAQLPVADSRAHPPRHAATHVTRSTAS